MASSMTSTTVTTANLSDGTNSTSSTNCISGSAKAWVNFNGNAGVGTLGAIRASYNVSSITVVSNSNFTVNFASALASASYSCVTGAGNANQGARTASIVTMAAGSVQVRDEYGGQARTDADYMCVACFL